MKLALCLEYPIAQFGGTEMIVRELIRGLPTKYEIVLVSPDTDSSLRNFEQRSRVSAHLQWNPAGVSFAASSKLAHDLRAGGVELAHFHFGGNYGWGNRVLGQCPVVFLQRLGIPCLSNNNGVFSIFEGYCGAQRWFVKLAYFIPAWLSKVHVLSKLETEVAVSQHDYEALRRYYFPLRNKFQVIYPSRLREHERREPRTRSKTIVCVGTIGPRKGQQYLVKAFARIAAKHGDWQLVLVGRRGDNDLLDQINRSIVEHKVGQRVQLLSHCSAYEVDDWMRTAAIFAMPSIAEGLGLSLQEALFSGCACVASRIGGIPDLIEHEKNGLLVESGNIAELADALDRLISDEKLRTEFSSQGPKSIIEKEMTAEQMVTRYANLYDRTLLGA